MADFAVELALGDHSMILKEDGSVWSTGATESGLSNHFVKMIPNGAMAVAAGTGFSIVLKKDSSVWAVGRNFRGQLGDGTKYKRDTFFFVRVIIGAKAVAAGGYHGMILTREGSVWGTGWNVYGQLGDDSSSYRARFCVVISSGVKVVAVAAGELHSVLLKQDGSVWAAGRNQYGQLGDGSDTDRKSFVKVMSRGAKAVAAGGYHSMVLKEDGSVWATGWNEFGQLGDGSTSDRSDYLQVSSGVKSVAAGRRHTMLLKHNGSVWGTGYNNHAQLGIRWKTAKNNVFEEVFSAGVEVIAAGAFRSMVVKQDGSIWITDSNAQPRISNAPILTRDTFVKIEPFDNGSVHDHCMNASSLFSTIAQALPCIMLSLSLSVWLSPPFLIAYLPVSFHSHTVYYFTTIMQLAALDITTNEAKTKEKLSNVKIPNGEQRIDGGN